MTIQTVLTVQVSVSRPKLDDQKFWSQTQDRTGPIFVHLYQEIIDVSVLFWHPLWMENVTHVCHVCKLAVNWGKKLLWRSKYPWATPLSIPATFVYFLWQIEILTLPLPLHYEIRFLQFKEIDPSERMYFHVFASSFVQTSSVIFRWFWLEISVRSV